MPSEGPEEKIGDDRDGNSSGEVLELAGGSLGQETFVVPGLPLDGIMAERSLAQQSEQAEEEEILEAMDEEEEIPEKTLSDLLNELLAKRVKELDWEKPGVKLKIRLITQGRIEENGAKKATEVVGYKLELRIGPGLALPRDYQLEVFLNGQGDGRSGGWHDPLYLGKIPEDDEKFLGNPDEAFLKKIIGEKLAAIPEISALSQKKLFECGPMVLEMALARLGSSLEADKLAQMLGTNTLTGSANSKMAEVPDMLGFDVFCEENSNFERLRWLLQCYPAVIVNYLESDDNDGHFALVQSLDKDEIFLQDPWHGEIEFSFQEFWDRWRSQFDRCQRWVMGICKRESGNGSGGGLIY